MPDATVPWSKWPKELHDEILRLLVEQGLVDDDVMALDLEYLHDLAQHPVRRYRRKVPGRRTLARRWGVSPDVARRILKTRSPVCETAHPPVTPRSPPADPPVTPRSDTVQPAEPAENPPPTPRSPPGDPPVTPSRALIEPTSLEPTTEVQGPLEGESEAEVPIPFPPRLVAPAAPSDSPPPSDLSKATRLALRAADLTHRTIAQMTRAQVLELPGIGPKRLAEIEGYLAAHGLELQPDPLTVGQVQRRATDVWAEVWRQATGEDRYPWELEGADRHRVRSWIDAFDLLEDLDEGLARLRSAAEAYCAAALAGHAWPQGDPPTTKRFTADLARWAQAGRTQREAGLSLAERTRRYLAGRDMRHVVDAE